MQFSAADLFTFVACNWSITLSTCFVSDGKKRQIHQTWIKFKKALCDIEVTGTMFD